MDFDQLAEREIGTAVQDIVRKLQDAAAARLRDVRHELEADLETVRRQADTLREELETESARAATLEADLDSVIEAHRQVDGERLKAEATLAEHARAHASLTEELSVVRELLDSARAEHVRPQDAFEAEAALKAIVEADLTATRESLTLAEGTIRRLEGSVRSLEQSVANLETGLREARDDADARLRETREAADAQLRDATQAAAAQLRDANETAAAELREANARAEAQLGDARDAALAQESLVAGMTTELAASRGELTAVYGTLQETTSALRDREEGIARLEADLEAARAEARALRTAVDEATVASERMQEASEVQATRLADAQARAAAAEAAARLVEDELMRVRVTGESADAMLQGSIRALESLAASTSVAALVAGLARQLAPHFARVAIFRVKGHHLEGEQGAGLDPSTDVTKLSIPVGVDSAITRAASSRIVQQLDADALADEPTPLGGSPAAALAVPVIFQGETFAVAYVDRSEAIEPSHRAFASLVAAQASVLLGRLAQELKVMKELRDYAALLVQEAEQMFVADIENGRPEADRRRRLGETIECARQLFAQRAALEGPAAARALDDYLSEVLTAPADSAFASDLAVVLTTDAHAPQSMTG